MKKIISIAIVIAVASALALLILRTEKKAPADPHGHGGHEEHGEEGHGGHDEQAGHEGHGQRLMLSSEAVKSAGIVVDTAGPAVIRKFLALTGIVQPNQDRMARMMPRFSGVVQEVRKQLGNTVAKGDVLAVIESNESLAPYSVVSQISGTVIQKNVNAGEFVTEQDILFTVADLSTVWVDFNVYRQDFARLKAGQEVLVRFDRDSQPVKGRISYLSPFGSENTQTMLARLSLPNPKGWWRPGLFVDGEATLSIEEVPLAVAEEALQTLAGKEVVFVKEDDAFEAREVELGVRDGEWVEVLSGVAPGDLYVSKNSFILKAEIGKGEAKHEH